MRLLRKLWVAITTVVFVLFGIVADMEDGASGGPVKPGDDEKKDKDNENPSDGSEDELTGDPVSVITGVMVVNAFDFELPGPIPLVWRRNWYSNSEFVGHFGHGFNSCFEMYLDVCEEKHINIFLSDGRFVKFPYLITGDEFFNNKKTLLLRREIDHFCLFDQKTRYSYLFYLSKNECTQYKLCAIRNAQGHRILIRHDNRGYISKVTDSVGRELDVTTNETGRILQVSFGDHILVKYRYNNEQDLTEVIDAAGQSTYMVYQDHLMIRKTDSNKNSFYWKYSRSKTGARVTETWGDGNVLHRKFEYHDDEQYNVITNSLGKETEYHYDGRMLCIRIVYADGSETTKDYNERHELVREVDEEGRVTSYTYNNRSQIICVERPDGSKFAYEYDETGRLVSNINPEGGVWKWIYNEDDTVHSIIDESGAETVYTYNENKLVEAVINALGDTIHLNYDADLNLNRVNLPDGSSSSWEFDSLGNCTNAVNPSGAEHEFKYDSLNRLVNANLPDGNEIQFTYNGYDDVVHIKDKQTEVSFDYTILGNLKSRVQCGKTVGFKYDTEEKLISVTNQKGEIYQFDRDIKGNISKEVGYDGVTRIYKRDYSGLLQEVRRPNGRFTKYERDLIGNITRVDYHDRTWETFGYNMNGELVEAANQHTTLKFERNAKGQIIKEWQDDYWVASEYNKIGKRIYISSSLGAKIEITRNQMGMVSNVDASQAENTSWTAQMQYNELGQEIERILPGDLISRWQYNPMGKLTQHSVQSHNHDTRQFKYDWDINNQLKKATNKLTGICTSYGYDELSNLVWSKTDNYSFMYRNVDDVGNLYETEDKNDRAYGAGSRLEQSQSRTRGMNLAYDVEGNLSQKSETNGNKWRYEYFGNRMLCSVLCPDKGAVTFKYDPLGRRVEKNEAEKSKKFVWIGNTLLHELEDNNIVTWVFNDGFTPTARLDNSGNYSIVSDHIGTPVEAYNTDGKCVWSVELDIYGRVKCFTGEVDFIPFRYQGQYHDLSSGLYYNRFRYYDPGNGQYTQQDPIGLDGGNPTLYGYVADPNGWIDPLGLIASTPVRYGSTDLSQAVIAERQKCGDFCASKNYAAARVQNEDGSIEIIVRANDPKGLHSEEKILAEVSEKPGSIITDLYTERMPCGENSANCSRKLSEFACSKGANVTYTVKPGAQGKSQLQAILNAIKP